MSSNRELAINLPPDYHQSRDVYPVAYMHMGKSTQDVGQIHLKVDQLIQGKNTTNNTSNDR